jgi:hypothetical protein
MEKYEAYNEVCEGLAVLKMPVHLQLQIAAVRVWVRVGSPTPMERWPFEARLVRTVSVVGVKSAICPQTSKLLREVRVPTTRQQALGHGPR